jgi:hypothetical protein
MDARAWSFLVFILVGLPSATSVRADIATLTVVGPNSGSGFANLGAIPKGPTLPTMSNAVVTILLKPGAGEDLVAECNANFTMDAGLGEPQPIIVAFPVTGQGGDAVRVTSFAVAVNGAQINDLLRGPIRFPRTEGEKQRDGEKLPTFDELMHSPWRPGGFPFGDGCTYPDAYYWSQHFPPNSRTNIEVSYTLTLRPQSLRYEKKMLRGGSIDVVPFDLMWAGASNEKAYFFDYILRSGATWAGPIGHETVTLIADPATHLDLSDEEIVVVGRNVARYFDDDTRDALGMVRAGLVPKGIRRPTDRIVWEIDHEKPTQDILVQIPASLRRRGQIR